MTRETQLIGSMVAWARKGAWINSATLLTNVAQLSDNETPGTGQPGASRPNLQISGATAVVAGPGYWLVGWGKSVSYRMLSGPRRSMTAPTRSLPVPWRTRRASAWCSR